MCQQHQCKLVYVAASTKQIKHAAARRQGETPVLGRYHLSLDPCRGRTLETYAMDVSGRLQYVTPPRRVRAGPDNAGKPPPPPVVTNGTHARARRRLRQAYPVSVARRSTALAAGGSVEHRKPTRRLLASGDVPPAPRMPLPAFLRNFGGKEDASAAMTQSVTNQRAYAASQVADSAPSATGGMPQIVCTSSHCVSSLIWLRRHAWQARVCLCLPATKLTCHSSGLACGMYGCKVHQ